MSDEKVLITESTLDEIADAIREKNGESFEYYPREMPSAVRRIPTGQGGGSVVAVFPVLLAGTHIADIVVDGDIFELYAPTPIEYTQGTGIEISAEGVISVSQALRNTIAGKVDNDTFTTAINSLTASIATKQNILTQGQGISIQNNVISADINASDLSDVDLNDLADGQVLKWNATSQKWENADESGGGGEPFKSESLYKSQSTTTANTITLSHPADNYDELRIIIRENSSSNYYYENSLSKTVIEQAINDSNIVVGAIFYSTYYAYYSFTSSTELTKVSASNNFHIDEIIGIKYGSGGSSLPFDVVIDSNDNGINLIYEYDDGQ